MSRIFVIGRPGVAGTDLVKELPSRGHEVWLCDLPHNHVRQIRACLKIGNMPKGERFFRQAKTL